MTRPPLTRASCALAALMLVPLDASSATRRLDIEIEPIIMLSCVEQVNYALDTARLLTSGPQRKATISAAGTAAASARMIEARFSTSGLLENTGKNIVEIDIEQACSVRGLGRGEGFVVDVRPSESSMLENAEGTGILAVHDALGRPSYGGAFTRRFAIPQQRIRLDTPITIDVQLRIDLSYADGSGEYSAPVDGVFAIEVAAP